MGAVSASSFGLIYVGIGNLVTDVFERIDHFLVGWMLLIPFKARLLILVIFLKFWMVYRAHKSAKPLIILSSALCGMFVY